MNYKKRVLALLTALLIFANSSFAFSVEEKQRSYHVLFISSYNYSFNTVPDQIEGIKSVFQDHKISLDIEFMDTKRVNDPENYMNFYTFLSERLDKIASYDAILVGDDNGLQFLMDYGQELFPDIPIVFFAINDLDRAYEATNSYGMTGVYESQTLDKNIELAMKFQPNATTVVAITDDTATGIGDRDRFYALESKFPRLTFTDINSMDYTFDEMMLELQKFDLDTILLYQNMFEDSEGTVITIDQSIGMIVDNTNTPVYRASVAGVGDGFIGGHMVSYTLQGKLAAEMVLDILAGKDISDIPMIEESPNQYFIDYEVVEKFNINPALIPEDAIIINKKVSIFEKYEDIIVPIVIIFVIMSAIILIFIYDNLRRRTIQNELQEQRDELSGLYEEITATEEELRDQYNALSKSREALKISESRNHAMLSGISDIIAIMNKDGIITYNSENIQKYFGWTAKYWVGRLGFEAVHEEDMPHVMKAFNSLLEGHDSVTVSFRYLCKDGTYKIVEVNAFNHLEDTSINGILINYRDITKQVESARRVDEERERLAVTLGNIGEGVIATDIDGRILIINKLARKIFKLDKASSVGKTINTVLGNEFDDVREAIQGIITQTVETGNTSSYNDTLELTTDHKTSRLITLTASPIRDQSSHVNGAVLVISDVTDRQQLAKNMQRIDKLNSLGILAGGIAHDFNNLLGGVFGYIDIAKSHTDTNSPVSMYLDKALTVYDRAKDLTQQLLTFSKGGEPNRKTRHLGNLAKKTMRFVLSGSNIKGQCLFPDDLWLADFDENQLGQVLDNLLINAQQAMPDGGHIKIGLDNIFIDKNEPLPLKEGRYVKMMVTDTGNGIPEDILNHIFDPFFTTKRSGNGLGLATCYSIIEKHQGYINVDSEVGVGTSFIIYLPASDRTNIDQEIDEDTNYYGKGTILIMDDEAFMLEILANMLQKNGYKVIETESGSKALEIAKTLIDEGVKLSVAIFDLTVPGDIGGADIINDFKSLYPNIPVFASSGFSENPVMSSPESYGFVDSINKPYRESDLMGLIKKHLSK